jgi:hypothetical protein
VQKKQEVEQLFSLKTIHNNFPFWSQTLGIARQRRTYALCDSVHWWLVYL